MDKKFYDDYKNRTPQTPEELEDLRHYGSRYRSASACHVFEFRQIIDEILSYEHDLENYDHTEADILLNTMKGVVEWQRGRRMRIERDSDHEMEV